MEARIYNIINYCLYLKYAFSYYVYKKRTCYENRLKNEFNEISFDVYIITIICHFLKLGYYYITFTS
jgi:hypothetical protein